jgi:hypothetical protein
MADELADAVERLDEGIRKSLSSGYRPGDG